MKIQLGIYDAKPHKVVLTLVRTLCGFGTGPAADLRKRFIELRESSDGCPKRGECLERLSYALLNCHFVDFSL